VITIRSKVNGQHLPHMALQQHDTAPRAAVPDPTCGDSKTQHSTRSMGWGAGLGAEDSMAQRGQQGAAPSQQYAAAWYDATDPALCTQIHYAPTRPLRHAPVSCRKLLAPLYRHVSTRTQACKQSHTQACTQPCSTTHRMRPGPPTLPVSHLGGMPRCTPACCAPPAP
jgi:hypothetical protein